MTSEEIIKLVKKSIVPERKLIKKNGDIIPIPKGRRTTINCFAYAIGAMQPEKGIEWYIPGFTTGHRYRTGDKEDFLEKLKMDLINLGFSYRDITINNANMLEKGEYIIKIFFADENAKKPGWHVIRKSVQNGAWFHKEGWERDPSLIRVPIKTYGKNKDEMRLLQCKIAPEGFQDAVTGDIMILIATLGIKYNG